MRIILAIFLFSVLQSFSQHEEPYKPLTPFADISFEEDMIIYTIDRKNIMMNPGLLPRVIDRRLLRLEFGNYFQNVSGKYIDESIRSIHAYTDTEVINLSSTTEQLEYLKLCALLVIIENNLSEHARSQIKALAGSGDKPLSQFAGKVLQLEDVYHGLR